MAKKGLAKFRAQNKPSKPKQNPGEGITHELGQVGSGVAAYTVTRLLGRVAHRVASTRWPKAAKHVAAGSQVAAAGAAYFGADRIEQLEPYRDPIVIGTSIAAAQSLLQTYLPKYGWIVSDVRPDDYKPKKPEQAKEPEPQGWDAFEPPVDDFIDVEPEPSGRGASNPPPPAPDDDDDDDDLFADLADAGGDQAGIF